MNLKNGLRHAVRLYTDGFRQMTWGRILWVLILAKLIVLFAILRPFFFRPALAGLDEEEKREAVADGLLRQQTAAPAAAAETDN